MSKKSRKAKLKAAKMQIGTLKHALRSEMSQSIYWVLILGVSVIVGIQILLLSKAV